MSSEYEKLEQKVRKIINLEETAEVLHWDQEVMMPEGGSKARSQQLSTISGLQHDILVSDELGNVIEKLGKKDLSQEKQAVLREIKREHERSKKIDSELVEKISEQSSTTLEKWKKARKQNDFSVAQKELNRLVELKREYAQQIDPDKEPYKVLFSDYEPYIKFETMEKIMGRLEDELVPIIDSIRQSNVEIENAFESDVSEKQQEKLNDKFLDILGYDLERGRLDVSEHPFTIGNQFDARITTRYSEEDISKSIMPTIHEFGHALYELGLPKEKYGLPTGQSRDLSIHESQSRLWENHVGRSKEFWKGMVSEINQVKALEDISSDQAYRAINRVRKDNLVRVEADELTYHLHVALRFELERKLINGDIEVSELPDLWDDKMEELLGVRPEDELNGVLQDIHWYQGSIGYFTTYSLGSVISAQLYSSMEEDIDGLDQKIIENNFSDLKEWLQENIHQHGKLYETEKLVEKATGEKPNADYFLNYIEQKYSEIYNL
jgi:carboxypeptidase Taq